MGMRRVSGIVGDSWPKAEGLSKWVGTLGVESDVGLKVGDMVIVDSFW